MITRHSLILILAATILNTNCASFHERTGKLDRDKTLRARRFKRQSLLINLDEISQNGIGDEVTNAGLIIRGGVDLPPGFSGSGSPDFAFSGESFRPAHIPLYTTKKPVLEEENNWQANGQINVPTTTSSPQSSSSQPTDTPANIPNACQIQCHKRTTGEYNPMCGSDGVTYFNPSKFRCALRCGRRITGRPNRGCGLGTPII